MNETLSDTSVEQQQERGDIASVMEEMPYGVYIVGSARASHPNAMIIRSGDTDTGSRGRAVE